jgi:hypothetical protein
MNREEIEAIFECNEIDLDKREAMIEELLNLHSVTNCYSLTDEQKKKMNKHKSNTVKFSHGSGIGVSVEIKTKKGKWKDITDYSCW